MRIYRRRDRRKALEFRPRFLLSEQEMASCLAAQFANYFADQEGPLPELGERAVRDHISTELYVSGMGGDDADWSEAVQQWAEATIRRLYGAVLDSAFQDS